MNDLIKAAEASLSAEKLTLAARNLQHYLKIQEEQVTLDAIVGDLRAALTHAGAPEKLSDILTLQTQILDAAFGYYMEKARGSYTDDSKVNMALKAQRQTVVP